MTDIFAQIQSAANAGAFGLNGYALPTAEQCRAGNYRKGRVRLYGLDIAIETPQGQRRMGKSDGKPWSVVCMAHYGDISNTRGADGDPVDCYVGPSPESNRVFVVNQNGKSGAFDEHKVMLAFADEDAARTAYMGSYERGWTGLGSMVSATVNQFCWWLKYGDTTKPFTKNALPYDGDDDMNEITWDSAGMPANSDLATILYGLRHGDREEGLLLDAVQMTDILEDAESMDILDALVVENAKLGIKMEQLRRIMDATGNTVKPISMQVSEPFRQKGTTNVTALFELSDGQTVAIFFHNPDATPHKILPQDELVSWKWLLNKKDVTILVAPEKGRDLNPREVARRIMRLAEKNSAKFQKANSARAERLAGIEQAKGAVAQKESALAALDAEIADLTAKVEARRANQAPDPSAPLGVSATDLAGSASIVPEIAPAEEVVSMPEIARRLVPAEFESRDDADGYTAVAADGYGIRLRLTAGGKMLGAYILKPGVDAQESMGSSTLANGVESAVRIAVDTALMFIQKWRDERPAAGQDAAGSVIVSFGTDQTSASSVVADRDRWMHKHISADQLNTAGDEGVGSIDLGGGTIRLVYRLNDGRLCYWDMESRSILAVAPSDSRLSISPAADERKQETQLLQAPTEALGAALAALGWANEDAGAWYKGDYIAAVESDAVVITVGTGGVRDEVGIVSLTGSAEGIAAKIDEYVPADQANANELDRASPTDEQILEAAAKGWRVYPTTKRVKNDDSVPDGVITDPVNAGKSRTDDMEVIDLWSSADVARAKELVDRYVEENAYKPFDRSALKMPSAAQVGAKGANKPTLKGFEGSAGWTNGHILDMGGTPPAIAKALDKVFGENRAGMRMLSPDAMDRVLHMAAGATTMVEPTALYQNDLNDAVILENEQVGLAVVVNRHYFAYFDRVYKQPDYFASGNDGALKVKKNGEVVGLLMPIRGGVKSPSLLRAATGSNVEPVAPGWETNGEAGTLRRDTLTKDELGKVYVLTVGGQYGSGYWQIEADGRVVQASSSADTQSSFAQLRDKGQTMFYQFLQGEHDQAAAAPLPGQEDDQMQVARELLQSVIDGTADMDAALADRLEAVYSQFDGDAEFDALFERAAHAYSEVIIAKAQAAIAA